MISDRKLEHLLLCKHYDVQYKNKNAGFKDIELVHNALPEINKEEIDISTNVFGKKIRISSFYNCYYWGTSLSS